MDPSMTVNGNMDLHTEMESLCNLMVNGIMALGKIIRNVVKENIKMEKVMRMLVNGKMINNMAKELKSDQMDHNILEIITWDIHRDNVIINGQMVLSLKDSGKKIKLMEQDTLNGKMERNTMANGKTMICMVLVYTSTPMV